MDALDLSRKMQRLTAWLDENCQPESSVRHRHRRQLISPSIRSGRRHIASANFNRVYLCGRESGNGRRQRRALDRIVHRAWREKVLCLAQPRARHGNRRGAGSKPAGCHAFPMTAIRRCAAMAMRRHRSGPISTSGSDTGGNSGRRAKRSARRCGRNICVRRARTASSTTWHSTARRPVAIAALAVLEGMAYLLAAATSEADRKRGAQQALIAARLARAKQLGCAIAGLGNAQHPRTFPSQFAARRFSGGLREGGLCLAAADGRHRH